MSATRTRNPQQPADGSPDRGRRSPVKGSEPRTATETDAASSGPRTRTIRLPLISVTFTRPESGGHRQDSAAGNETARGSAPAAGSRGPTGASSLGGLPLPRAAFYAGAVALGALQVVEWPVTALVLTGTYLADRARDSAATTAASTSAPSDTPSAEPTEV